MRSNRLSRTLMFSSKRSTDVPRFSSVSFSGLFPSFFTELHGLEDGSIPATFQIMHAVRPPSAYLLEHFADKQSSSLLPPFPLYTSLAPPPQPPLLSHCWFHESRPSQIGWKPDPSQPKPARRGSGTTNIADVIGDEGARKLGE